VCLDQDGAAALKGRGKRVEKGGTLVVGIDGSARQLLLKCAGTVSIGDFAIRFMVFVGLRMRQNAGVRLIPVWRKRPNSVS